MQSRARDRLREARMVAEHESLAEYGTQGLFSTTGYGLEWKVAGIVGGMEDAFCRGSSLIDSGQPSVDHSRISGLRDLSSYTP